MKKFFCPQISSPVFLIRLTDRPAVGQTGGVLLWVSRSTCSVANRMRNLEKLVGGFFFLTETSWYNCLMIICIISKQTRADTHTLGHSRQMVCFGIYKWKHCKFISWSREEFYSFTLCHKKHEQTESLWGTPTVSENISHFLIYFDKILNFKCVNNG